MYRVYFSSSMYFVPHFGHAKVYETSIWTPCFQISAKTLCWGQNPQRTLIPPLPPSPRGGNMWPLIKRSGKFKARGYLNITASGCPDAGVSIPRENSPPPPPPLYPGYIKISHWATVDIAMACVLSRASQRCLSGERPSQCCCLFIEL